MTTQAEDQLRRALAAQDKRVKELTAALERARAALTDVQAVLISEEPVSIYSAVTEASKAATLSDVKWWGLSLQIGELCKRIAAALGEGGRP